MLPNNLDGKTLALLEDLRKDFFIFFEVKDIDHCALFQYDKTATISYNPSIVDTESIAHELLHIWLSRFKQSFSTHLYISTRSNDKLCKIFSKDLCDYIGNCCDHNKMYSKYVEMGYSPAKFVTNGLAPKADFDFIKNINIDYGQFHSSAWTNIFIGCLISILADHVDNDYEKHHSIIKEKDKELYDIVVGLWNKWISCNIEACDTKYDSGMEIANSFITDMSDWVETKKFI